MRWCNICLLVIALAGCTGNAEKGINKNKEMPVPSDKQEKSDKK